MNIKNKVILFAIAALFSCTGAMAQGWQKSYKGVMLQGFYWDSYADTQWSKLESQANEIAPYFSLIWIPNSGYISGSNSMGYDVKYYFDQNCCFGTEAQLRSMIKTYKALGTGFIADVIVNHRNNYSSWFDFPVETYNGETYTMYPSDVVWDDGRYQDDNGKWIYPSQEEAQKEGVTLSSNKDEGDDFGAYRDLDHKSENVQKCVKAYTKFLLDDIGYAGFRYDMVKGFNGSHVKDYNKNAFGSNQIFSVGECWDNLSTVGAWLQATQDETGVPTSAAFDFPLKSAINACCNYGGYYGDNLKNGVALSQGTYKQFAVTFVENHDTNAEQNNNSNQLKKDTLAANAIIIGFPGTPCVFLTHWKKYKNEIREMILARQAAGVTNTASFHEKEAVTGKDGYYAWSVLGSENLYCVVGNCSSYATPTGYTLVIDGADHHYRYYLKNTLEMAWSSQPTCNFEQPMTVTLTAVSADANAKVVYTLDGSDPTSSSTVYDGTPINITATTTLKYALLKDGVVGNVQTRTYTYAPFTPYKATVYVKADFTPVYFHLWDADGKINTTWPGITPETTTVDGETWYYKTVDVNSSDYYFNFIINQGSGMPQTSDINYINSDKYFTATITDGSVVYTDVTDQHVTAISPVIAETPQTTNNVWYTLNGMRISTPTAKGVYIHNGKKVVVK